MKFLIKYSSIVVFLFSSFLSSNLVHGQTPSSSQSAGPLGLEFQVVSKLNPARLEVSLHYGNYVYTGSSTYPNGITRTYEVTVPYKSVHIDLLNADTDFQIDSKEIRVGEVAILNLPRDSNGTYAVSARAVTANGPIHQYDYERTVEVEVSDID